jgi:hypothetical protein
MDKKLWILSGTVLLALLASGPVLFGQASRTGQQVPAMPRVWDEGVGSWANIGASPFGLMAGFSRQFERSVVTLHGELYFKTEDFAGGDLGLTIGLPLNRRRVFASVGGGIGCLIGRFGLDAKIKHVPCLAGDLQLFLRFSSRLGLGVYSTLGVSTKKTVGGVFFCLQYGGWGT